jgi:hypothetical protein
MNDTSITVIDHGMSLTVLYLSSQISEHKKHHNICTDENPGSGIIGSPTEIQI